MEVVLGENDVDYIRKQYLCCAPINTLKFGISELSPEISFDYDTQIRVLEATIEDPLSMKYPSRLSYRMAFLRRLIEKCEESGRADVCDKMYETLASYMLLSDDKNPLHFRQFTLEIDNRADRIIIQESKTLISEGTTGLHSWQAAFALAEWCYANGEMLNDKRILELGSGTGLTGLSVLLTTKPKSYAFSDCHLSVLEVLLNNVELNLTEEKGSKCAAALRTTIDWRKESFDIEYRSTAVQIARLPWSSIKEAYREKATRIADTDVLLAADVVYDESLFDQLVEAIHLFVTRSNALVVVAAAVRNDETLSAFLKRLESRGLSYRDEIVPKPRLFLPMGQAPLNRILRVSNKIY